MSNFSFVFFDINLLIRTIIIRYISYLNLFFLTKFNGVVASMKRLNLEGYLTYYYLINISLFALFFIYQGTVDTLPVQILLSYKGYKYLKENPQLTPL